MIVVKRLILNNSRLISLYLDGSSICLTQARCSSNLPRVNASKNLPKVYNLPIVPREQVPHSALKKIKLEYHGVEEAKFNEEINWYPVYRFPYIEHLRVIIRVKVYLTILSVFVSATQLTLFISNPTTSLFGVALLSSITFGGLFYIGNFFRKFICQVYTSQNVEYIRLCRLTFFGKRRDMILPVESIVPLTENNESFRRSYLELLTKMPENLLDSDSKEFYDEKFKICLLYGGVSDLDRFEKALGRLLSRKLTV